MKLGDKLLLGIGMFGGAGLFGFSLSRALRGLDTFYWMLAAVGLLFMVVAFLHMKSFERRDDE